MPEVPTDETLEPATQTVTSGYFEREFNVTADSVGDFLIDLGEQLKSGDELTITGEGWEIPFTYAEPVELEIEFEGDGQPELEIEIELDGLVRDQTPSLR